LRVALNWGVCASGCASRRPTRPVPKDHPSRVPVWPGPDNRERCLAGKRRMPIIRGEFLDSPAASADLAPYGWAYDVGTERCSTSPSATARVTRIRELSVTVA